MMDPRREEQVMKRTVVIVGILAAFLVAPSVANAGNVAQVRPQVVESDLVRSQVVEQQVVRQVVRQQVVRQVVSRQVVRQQVVRKQLGLQRAMLRAQLR
jgi:hypothetical protein